MTSDPDDVDRRLVAAALPDYDVGTEIGRGAWGIVVAARHRALGRDVAVKVLAAGPGGRAAARDRFLAEARVLASLQHPHVVPVYDYREHEGAYLLVMELLTGGSLGDRMRREQLDAPSACAAVLDALAGLGHAHDAGVLHRDVKPDNLMLGADGDLKVADFGIAKVVGDVTATVEGELLGSPAYMAPEQLTGEPLGPATDVYAAATVLYEALAGRTPHSLDGDALAVAYRHVHEEPRPLRAAAPQVPGALAAAVDGGLARQSSARPRSAAAFAHDVLAAADAAWGAGWDAAAAIPLTEVARAHARAGAPTGPARAHAAAVGTRPDDRPARPGSRRRWVPLGAAAAVVLLALGGLGWGLAGRGGGPPEPATAWVTTVAGAVVGTPAAVEPGGTGAGGSDGVAGFVVGDGAGLRRLDAATGETRWTRPVANGVRSSPVLAGGTVFAGGDDGALHAVDVADGTERWRAELGLTVTGTPAVAGDLVIVAVDAVAAFDAATGEEVWRTALPEVSVSSPVVAGGLVVLGADDGVVRGLDVADGRVRWTYPAGDRVRSSAAVADDVVIVGSEDGVVHAISRTDGAPAWQVGTGGPVRASPAVAGDLVVVGSADGTVRGLDPATGAEVWRTDLGARVESRLVATGGTVVAGDTDGGVHGLDAATGAVRWRATTGGAVLGGVATLDDLVVVGSGDATVRALRPPR